MSEDPAQYHAGDRGAEAASTLPEFFIGAKTLDGKLIVAVVIRTADWEEAAVECRRQAAEQVGEGNFRVTAVNEQTPPQVAIADMLGGHH